MNTKRYSEKLALAAGTVSLAASPLAADAAAILGTGGPISVSQTNANGTTATWDVDGDGNDDFLLRVEKLAGGGGNFTDRLFLESNGLNGRGLVGGASVQPPFYSSLNFLALGTSFYVGPSLAAGFYWGASQASQREVIFNSQYAGNDYLGFDDLANGAAGPNLIGFRFDSGNGLQYGWAELMVDLTAGSQSLTITQWTYSDTPDEQVHVGTAGTAPPGPGTPVTEPASTLPAIALLGLGAMGVRRWREQRKAAA